MKILVTWKKNIWTDLAQGDLTTNESLMQDKEIDGHVFYCVVCLNRHNQLFLACFSFPKQTPKPFVPFRPKSTGQLNWETYHTLGLFSWEITTRCLKVRDPNLHNKIWSSHIPEKCLGGIETNGLKSIKRLEKCYLLRLTKYVDIFQSLRIEKAQ